jgi:hypothetical protein
VEAKERFVSNALDRFAQASRLNAAIIGDDDEPSRAARTKGDEHGICRSCLVPK